VSDALTLLRELKVFTTHMRELMTTGIPGLCDQVDPQGESRALAALQVWMSEIADDFQARAVDFNPSENIEKLASDFAAMRPRLDAARRSVSMLRGAYETLGITAIEIEIFAERYGVEIGSDLPDWETLSEIKDHALRMALKIERARPKKPRVTDDKILGVVRDNPGATQAQLAKKCALGVRQLQRRLATLERKS
jgi:hypothetical protein